MAEKRRIKARYKTVGPRKEMVSYTKCTMVKDGDGIPGMQHEQVTEEMETWMVYFPQGHSIRILGKKALEASGYHLKPRMVDMDTGDVVDPGGDPYDFSDAGVVDLEDQDIETLGDRKRKAA